MIAAARAAAAVAVCSCVVLCVSVVVPALREPGLWLLFSVPLVRNVVVVVRGDAQERGLALLGLVVIGAVLGVALTPWGR